MGGGVFFFPPGKTPQQGPGGIFYDFNDGARLLLSAGDWGVEISGDEKGKILFACGIAEGRGINSKEN
ncbi:hypothetical protein [Cronobacter sakazakii]|uniref:hypothetical protein n=1 Tax=Cronobacter sakazakii TaxID=28141 RepID=UPI0030DB46DA